MDSANKSRPPLVRVAFSEIMPCFGVAGTGLALMMAGWGIKSLWDQLNVFIGLFAGGLGCPPGTIAVSVGWNPKPRAFGLGRLS